jgi:regulator of nucleoside diphosphate kinase
VLIQDQAVVTTADRARLREMIDSLRASLPTSGEPYGSYLRALEERLAQMPTVAEDEVDDRVVTMNSKVCVQDVDTDQRQLLTLAYPSDADPFGEKVSVLTSLGAAVLGSRVGEVVEWQTRRHRRRMRIERIVFQPEAAGRFDL